MNGEKKKPLNLVSKERKAKKRIELGRRIARLRVEAGFRTQTELAERLPGITPTLISNWENGTSAPDIFAVPHLCKTLGCTYGQFFGHSVFVPDQDIDAFGKFVTLTDAEKEVCLAFIDFVISRRSDSTDKK